MPRVLTALVAALLIVTPALADENAPFQVVKKGGLEVDGVARQEWTRKIFVGPDETRDDDRWRLRLLPRVSTGGEKFMIGVGGDFNYSKDENVDPKPSILRDNYDSRSARLDLAFAHLQPLSWLEVDGGRFVMPIGFTEMIWDKDLRPQGGAARLSTGTIGDIERLTATFLYSQGSHVFDDGKARMLVGNATARLKAGMDHRIEVSASYLDFSRLDELEPMIRRQNTRDPDTGFLRNKFRVMDVVVRMHIGGGTPMQVVGDMAWNTEAEEQNRGVWVGVVLGSLKLSRARAEYAYASMDRDVTVAAYATDDFFWATGWQGHRLDIGTRFGDRMSTHIIGQLQRFKDAPTPEEQDHWMQRLRVEVRLVP
jgi:hypothetical protein